MYYNIVKVMAVKHSWLNTMPSEGAQELSELIKRSIDELSTSPPVSLKGKDWKIVSHCITPIQKHLVLTLILLVQ
jgi:hypothetical protein